MVQSFGLARLPGSMSPTKLPRASIVEFLKERQCHHGGFLDSDLTGFAHGHDLNPVAFQKRVQWLVMQDPAFHKFVYEGRRPGEATLQKLALAFEEAEAHLLATPGSLVTKLNYVRQEEGLPPLSRRTAYRAVQFACPVPRLNRRDALSWFAHAQVPVGPAYDARRSRASLETHFSWSNLSTPYGVSISKTLERLQAAETLFQSYHPGVEPHLWYEGLRPWAANLSGFLGSVAHRRELALSASLTFELQALWLTEARDFLFDQVRLRKRRLREKLRSRHAKAANKLLHDRETEVVGLLQRYLTDPTVDTRQKLLRWVDERRKTEGRVQMSLRLDPGIQTAYDKLFRTLSQLTHGFSSEDLKTHFGKEGRFLQIAHGEITWERLRTDERPLLLRDGRALSHLSLEQQAALRKTILTDRIIDSLTDGSLTVRRSWAYQDMGARVAGVRLPADANDWPLPPAVLDDLLSGTYPVDLSPLGELRSTPTGTSDGDEEGGTGPTIGYTELAREVHEAVLEHNPDWYPVPRRNLEEYWRGAFQMRFREEAFTERLLRAIGLLGLNFRFRDDPAYYGLRHFLRRYVTPVTLETELRFYHDTLAALLGRRAQVLIVDTIGREGRSTHPMSTWHPRYLLQGFADFRGIGELRLPIYSLAIPSRDSEAMNAVEIVARARRVAGEGIRIYMGDGHTVSRLSAGLLFGTFSVLSAGHIIHDPPRPNKSDDEFLRRHLESLNRLFLLLRQSPELGRVFSTRRRVFLRDGTNIRLAVERLGCAVIHAVQEAGYDWRVAQPHIESSNALKRAVTAASGGAMRLEPHRIDLSLLSGELILLMGNLRSCLHRREGEAPSLYTGLAGVSLYRPT